MSVEDKINRTEDIDYIEYLFSTNNVDMNKIEIGFFISDKKSKLLLEKGYLNINTFYKRKGFDFIKPYLNKDNINYEIKKGMNLLMMCVFNGNIEEVKHLLSFDVDINQDYNNHNVLTISMVANNFEMFKFLLDNGADPKLTFHSNMKHEFRKEILSRLDDINVTRENDFTIMKNAIKSEDHIIVQELIERNAIVPEDMRESFNKMYKVSFNLGTEEQKIDAIKKIMSMM